jgi:hypothetical protein
MGKEYYDALAPDEFSPINWFHYGTDEDPVLNAAIYWVKKMPK